MWSNIKTAVKEHVSSENVFLSNYILLVDDHDEVAVYLPSTNQLVSLNQRAN